MKNNTLLEINGLGKEFNMHILNDKRIEALSNINMDLEEGEIVGLVGKSGSGKSTLMKCIYRTYLPTQGDMRFKSKHYGVINLSDADPFKIINLRKTEITYCSQFLEVIPRVPAVDVVAGNLLINGMAMSRARGIASEYLEELGLAKELWDAYPSTFSGGEQQRINVARAIIAKPKFLLIDEPTASLDQRTKDKVIEMVLKLKSTGTSVLCISHDAYTLEKMCDRNIELINGKIAEHAVVQ